MKKKSKVNIPYIFCAKKQLTKSSTKHTIISRLQKVRKMKGVKNNEIRNSNNLGD